MTRQTARTGLWAAGAAGAAALGFDLAVAGAGLAAPLPPWTDGAAYVAAFHSVQMLPDVLALLLVPAFLVMLAAVHERTPPAQRLRTRTGIVFAIVYAAIVSVNYAVQLVVVRFNILAGESAGLSLLAMTNPRSIFWALEAIGYGFMSLSLMAVAPAFSGSRLESWVRVLFLVNGGIGVLAAVLFLATGSPAVVFTSLGVWALLFPLSAALVAAVFRRELRAAVA